MYINHPFVVRREFSKKIPKKHFANDNLDYFEQILY